MNVQFSIGICHVVLGFCE